MSVQRTGGWLPGLAALALLIGLAAAVYGFIGRSGFNEDEFFQLTFVHEPLSSFLLLFLRLDQHPPFHFLQLMPWAAISENDHWMLANSLLWHGISCAVIWAVGRAWLGRTAGWLAVAFFALMPQAISASNTLRFYAMIPALALLAWWLHVWLLSDRQRPARWWWALGLVQLALGYSHAIAFYFVFWIALAAALQRRFGADPAPAPWRRWFAVQGITLLLLVPQVLLTAGRAYMARGAGGDGNQDPGGLIDHFGGMTAGWGMQWGEARLAGALLFAAALLLGLRERRTRWLALVMLVGPYGGSLLIGLVLAPMFKTPVYSAMLLPFACLCLAGGLLALGERAGAWASAAVLAAMAAFVFPATAHLNRGISPYVPMAAELKRVLRPGDVVVVPKLYLYWATLRYAVQPNWGAPLAVLPDLSSSWQSLAKRLGPAWSERLRLLPRTNHIQHQGVTYVVGEDARRESAGAQRVWVLERKQYPSQVQLDPGLQSRGVVYRVGQPELLELQLHER
ncbi:hypothetical protein [Aquabacterium sp.]|uniref:hypothetical protein n=1 Tax=Aquabacterium sp. TaxID=1872578 RepID=UPI003783266A